jgi:hypothetical protein
VFDEEPLLRRVRREYAKAGPDDVLIRVTVANRGPEAATLHLLPTLWFRNTWSWGRSGEEYWPRPSIVREGELGLLTDHASLGTMRLAVGLGPYGRAPQLLFTENETNAQRLFGAPNNSPFVKDAFHEFVVNGRSVAINPQKTGTKAAAHYRMEIPAGGQVTMRFRLYGGDHALDRPLDREFDAMFEQRYEASVLREAAAGRRERRGAPRRAGAAGLLWTSSSITTSSRTGRG